MSKNSVEVLAANVIRLRKKKKLSIQYVAFHAKMSENGIRNVERCKSSSSLTVVDALAEVLEVTPAALLTPKRK